jgi:hypothetical protein
MAYARTSNEPRETAAATRAYLGVDDLLQDCYFLNVLRRKRLLPRGKVLPQVHAELGLTLEE